MPESTQSPIEYRGGTFRPLLMLFLIAALLPLYLVTENIAEESLNQETARHLTRIHKGLETTLARHTYLPALLAEQNTVKNYLANIANGHMTNPDAVNLYLERANHISGTSDIYLITPSGNTVAASNWNQSQTFIGKNFSFRPYFQEAMQGKLGRYYALGTTSNTRGYYFARPVYDDGIIGVVTIKISINEFEANWSDEAFDFVVTDPDGVVFLSSNREWRLHPLQQLDHAGQQRLMESRRYGKVQLAALNVRQAATGSDALTQWQIGNQKYLVQSQKMNTAGWTVSVLAPINPIINTSLLVTAIGLLLLLLSALLIGAWWQRQTAQRQFEARTREELESKVEHRTSELRQAQENLVQAAKMAALGELSAGINHELNNPLTAIRAYAENAAQFLARGETETVRTNLGEITMLTERMAAITHQLKSFSRKSEGQIVCVDLGVAVTNALIIVNPKISRLSNAVVKWEEPHPTLFGMGDLIWIEQILVNLLTNAIEAIQNSESPEIQINISKKMIDTDQHVICLSVTDNGTGIDTRVMPNLFEPFFTTKSAGKGLGLGLSISYRLAKQMQGSLDAHNHAAGGAVFTLTLPTTGEEQ